MFRTSPISFRLPTHRLGSFLLLAALSSMAGCQNGKPTGQVAVAVAVDFAAAEQLLPKAWPGLKSNSDGMSFRCSPDGQQVAWLAVRDGLPIGSTGARRLELLVAVADGTAPRATLLHEAAEWPDYASRGPVWLADSSGVLVGYHTKDAATNQKTAHVDLVSGSAAAKPVLLQADARLGSLAVARDTAAIAVLLHEDFPTSTKSETILTIQDREGPRPRTLGRVGSSGGRVAAAPDGSCFAVATMSELFVVPVAGGDPRPVCDIRHDADLVVCPQWLEDGKALVVAAGGGVVHAHRETGLLHAWTEGALGGRAVAVVVLPGDEVAAAIVLREQDGNALQLLLGAGHAPQRTFADLVWLRLADGEMRRSNVTVEVVDRGRHSLPYLPRLSELLAKYQR